LGCAFLFLLAWLANSDRPNELRAAAINEMLVSVELSPSRLAALREQASWIVRNAELAEPVYVEQFIDPSRLNIVVTDERFFELTRASKGNAIYDPDLETIFIDKYLLKPDDLPYIGVDGPAVQFSESEFGFWNTGLSFIIAHELGHHVANDQASAFLSKNWPTGSRADLNDEVMADSFAVRTLARAYADPNMPTVLQNENAL
jgi:hypothetical protein